MTNSGTSGYGHSAAHPSLALIKYWGKADSVENLPATPSLAVTLDGLKTETSVWISRSTSGENTTDAVFIDGVLQEKNRFEPFFRDFRKLMGKKMPGLGVFSIKAESSSDFPSAAGLASSSSGFAALACACNVAAEADLTREELSALARIGSASAARSLYGGFTSLGEGRKHAKQLFNENWWPEFRIIILELEKEPKEISSRQAMEQTRLTSPYYNAWVKDSVDLMSEAEAALRDKNLEILGPIIRKSYLRMFATMFAADPPVIYWKPVSLGVIRLCEKMRSEGISVWETMDAGPQVKLFCTENETGK
ncbi:MAG: diphosphomevalonate decarboxylase, partial [Spirochaetes bacterium]